MRGRKATPNVTMHRSTGLLVFFAVLISVTTSQQSSATQIDLANLLPTEGFVVHGSQSGAFAGQGVTPVYNDFSGDGFRDLVISEPGAAQVHVTSGYNSGSQNPLDLGNLNGADGFTITGIHVGYGSHEKTIATDGDVNGDFFPDFAVGGHNGVNVIYGDSLPYLPTQSIGQLVNDGRADQLDPTNQYGPFTSIEFYRDFDIDDSYLFMSSKTRPASGKTYSWNMAHPKPNLANSSGSSSYGAISAMGDIIRLGLNHTGIVLGSHPYIARLDVRGPPMYLVADREIGNISSIGDIDGDSLIDFAIGVRSDLPHKPIAYVVYGKSSHLNDDYPPFLSLPAMTPDQGFAIRVYDNIDSTGYIANGGINNGSNDVDGDGRSDLVVGSFGSGPNGAAAKGKAYVLFGQPDRSSFGAAVNVTNTNGMDAATIVAAAPGDSLGLNVAVTPMYGTTTQWDIVMGARTAHVERPGVYKRFYAGAVYVVFGKPRPW